MKSFRTAFALTLTLNLLLAVGLAFLWWQSNSKKSRAENVQEQSAATPSMASQDEVPLVPSSTETPLAPVQLTPQRLQSIGVQFGVVQSEISRGRDSHGRNGRGRMRLASHMFRFGFPVGVQEVFADSTYQYVRKGPASLDVIYQVPIL